jgi:hypothetical protein
LESKGIDVILGMNWLSKHKVLIDCAMKSINLTTPDGKKLEYVAEPVVTTKGATNCVMWNQLDASQGPVVPVVVGTHKTLISCANMSSKYLK